MTSRSDLMFNQDVSAPMGRARDRDTRVTAVALGLSGGCFLLYPAIRPFSDEASLAGATAFASTSWLVAHTLGIAAFILLAVGMFGLYSRTESHAAETRGRWALLLTWVGVGLTLPYYGAEVFGLHAVGAAALDRSDTGLLTDLTAGIRWGLGIWFIVTGLILLAVAGVIAALAVWSRFDSVGRWSGIPLAVGLALYLPQFTGSSAIRVTHGFLMAVGCCWLAWNLGRTPAGRRMRTTHPDPRRAGGELG